MSGFEKNSRKLSEYFSDYSKLMTCIIKYFVRYLAIQKYFDLEYLKKNLIYVLSLKTAYIS